MRLRPARPERGERRRPRPVGRDLARWRLWIGVLLLALLPATIGVVLTSTLSQESGLKTAADRARLTSTAATDLLVRSQGIETRLAALAANAELARLTATSSGSERQLARRSMTALQGRDGSIVAGACVTRVADKRMTVIAKDRTVGGQDETCASGALLARAAKAAAGEVVRTQPPGSNNLLLATPIAAGVGPDAVLAASINLDALLARTSSASTVAPTALLVDTHSAALVTGASQSVEDAGTARTPPAPDDLAAYVSGVLSDYQATDDKLARLGWETTVAELWPTINASSLGLIHVWPLPQSSAPTVIMLALLIVGGVALVGVIAFMRGLIKPFRELEVSQSTLETMYREARQDSLHDGLTGMGNHRAFQDELVRQVKLSERDGVTFSLMLIDLDNLKVVNDREGHAEGDRLLTSLAAAMREALRSTDRLFRIGGDEFAVLMPDTEPEDAVEAAGRLRHYCLRPPSGERATPFSGGISAVPRFALEPSRVQRQADAALYWAKRHGRGFIEVFDPDRDKLHDDAGPEGIGNAVYDIARGRALTPVFQPIVDLRTGVVLGFEALVRPEPGGPFPDSEHLFTAAAQSGRTVELDLASLETVAEGASGISNDHILSLNLSAKTLEVKDFDSGWLLNTLVRYGISPSRVIVELTERDPIVDVKRLQNNVRHLSEYGLRLAADDVGAGSAGLRMLAEVPFDVVKIDLSLVQSGAQHAASWAVLRSIRDLAWRQEAVIIGEGVETPAQLNALQQLGIPIGQGYLLGRPDARPDARPLDLANLTAAIVGKGAPPPPPADRGVAPPPSQLPDLPVHQPSQHQLPLQPAAGAGA